MRTDGVGLVVACDAMQRKIVAASERRLVRLQVWTRQKRRSGAGLRLCRTAAFSDKWIIGRFAVPVVFGAQGFYFIGKDIARAEGDETCTISFVDLATGVFLRGDTYAVALLGIASVFALAR